MKLSKYPANLRRGGSLFTMVIFIMLLISTALMYYYFQRTRFLERQITAFQNGEQPEPSGLSNFVSWVKGTQPSETMEINAAAEPPKSTPRPQPQPAEMPVAEPDTIPDTVETEADTATGEEPSLLPLTEETTGPAILEAPDETEGSSEIMEGSEDAPDSGESGEDEDRAREPDQPINSLYDTQQPPPVRVRSPQRR